MNPKNTCICAGGTGFQPVATGILPVARRAVRAEVLIGIDYVQRARVSGRMP